VDVARIYELEARVKHDVVAFTMAVGDSIEDPAAARWLHYGMTSNDVVDTAQALQVRDASKLIERDLVMFGEILDVRAHEFRHTPQIGRTHGIHAEPITFGLKIANWFSENQRNITRFRDAAEQMAVGKISGAVGNASHLGTEMEERICKRLGLSVAPVASQVIQRDRHAQYLSALALIAATLEKNRARNSPSATYEVREAEEPFSGEQRGSSAMPHKRNPSRASKSAASRAWCVRICSLHSRTWLVARARHSPTVRRNESSSRFHHSCGLHAFQMTAILGQMRVFPERMIRNLESTHGLVYSGQLLQDLVEKGMPGMTPTRRCRKAPWQPGSQTPVSVTVLQPIARIASTRCESARAHVLIFNGSFAMWMLSSIAYLAHILPERNPRRFSGKTLRRKQRRHRLSRGAVLLY